MSVLEHNSAQKAHGILRTIETLASCMFLDKIGTAVLSFLKGNEECQKREQDN